MKVIKIGATWCSGCIVMKPRWQEIEKENPWLETEYFDFDKDEKRVEKFNLEEGKLPAFIFLDKEGKELVRLHGEVEKKKIVELINKYQDI
jgi:thiol-disulfide isomerase/thioredoxin